MKKTGMALLRRKLQQEIARLEKARGKVMTFAEMNAATVRSETLRQVVSMIDRIEVAEDA